MGLIQVFRRFGRAMSQSQGNRGLRRRLAVESLEPRALLSVAASPISAATQHLTVADLPAATQEAFSLAVQPQVKLTASDGAADNFFGDSVAISGNTMVVGAPDAEVGAKSEQGAAYVFVASGTSWVQVAKLTASDGSASDQFGSSVSFSGNTVVVGADEATVGSNVSQGAAYVFVEPGSGWASMTQTAKLTADDGAAQDNFGCSVSISGSTVVVGADNKTVGGNDAQGVAYVFTEPAFGWRNMTQTARLTASGGATENYFGGEVSISGNTVAVGSSLARAAYVFVEPGSGWASMTQTATLTAYNCAAYDNFGGHVSISGNTVVVGAPSADFAVPGVSGPGAAYVFVEPSSGWANMTQTAELTPSDGEPGEIFGGSVSISGNTVVVGAPHLPGTDTPPSPPAHQGRPTYSSSPAPAGRP